MLSGLLLGSTLALVGCGAGQYQIPNVEPVVKPKPGNNLLGLERFSFEWAPRVCAGATSSIGVAAFRQ